MNGGRAAAARLPGQSPLDSERDGARATSADPTSRAEQSVAGGRWRPLYW